MQKVRPRRKVLVATAALAAWLLGVGAVLAEECKEAGASPLEDKVVTRSHKVRIEGRELAYQTTTGHYVLRTETGKPRASVFFVAYTLEGKVDPAKRPVTFSFNGGPGAAALWVHLGAYGPLRVKTDPEGMPTPPPGELVTNPHTLLPTSDLVFIDPVSTGFSRPAPCEDRQQFHGFQGDLDSVGEFIRLWTTRHERWASPKFLAGESYGTTRAAGLANHLQERYGMFLNGVVLVSSVLHWQNLRFDVGNDLPFLIFLPSYTVAAWYHKRLPAELAADLGKTLAEVERFAWTDYAVALHAGDTLAPAERRRIAERVARYTGLSVDYVERSNLRVEIYRFTKELLRGEGRTIGRLDSRFLGRDLDSVGEIPEFDPSLVGVVQGYVTLFNDYVRRQLGYESDLPYEYITFKVHPWAFEVYNNRYLNVAELLRQAMTRNPALKVLVTSGLYDLATPYVETKYAVSQMGLPPELRGNVEFETFDSGHMMYIREVDHAKLGKVTADFVRRASGN